jgi:hypothetical protein
MSWNIFFYSLNNKNLFCNIDHVRPEAPGSASLHPAPRSLPTARPGRLPPRGARGLQAEGLFRRLQPAREYNEVKFEQS